jgi:hypothetical protein
MRLQMILQLSGLKKRDVANNEVICLHKFIHVRCCAHVINLIVHNGLNDVDD